MASSNNGSAALAFISSHRPAGATSWTVPRWDSVLSTGIFPLGALVEGQFIPIGTATLISGSGIVVSAWHNIHESFTYARDGESLRRMREPSGHHSLGDLGLSVLHSHYIHEAQRVDLSVWPLWHCSAAPPTDLVFGSLIQSEQMPLLAFPVTFAVPRVGERLTCLGYGNMEFPAGGIPTSGVRDGSFNIVNDTRMDLRVVEGRVSRIMVNKLAKGYGEGPCVLVDCAVEHGQSGGPVLNEQGYICGVVSSSFGDRSVMALLFPALMTKIRTKAQLGIVTLSADYALLDRVVSGEIQSDGTETLHSLTPHENGEWMVNPAILKEDGQYVHDDVDGMQNETRATPAEGAVWKVRVHDREKPRE